jgi:hypothetical protein
MRPPTTNQSNLACCQKGEAMTSLYDGPQPGAGRLGGLSGTYECRIDLANGPSDMTPVNWMTCAQAFRWYNEHGFLALPAHPVIKKLLLPRGYHFHDLRFPSQQEIAGIERNWPRRARVALVMSRASGMFGIDADDMGQWRRFQAEHEVTATLCQLSGREGGGFHLIYRRPQDETAIRQGPWSRSYPNIDVKSNGTLMASPSLHPSGRRYQWAPGPVAYLAEPACQMLASRPDVLHNPAARNRAAAARIGCNASSQVDANGQNGRAGAGSSSSCRRDESSRDSPDLTELTRTGIPRGQRNNELYRLACAQFRRYGTGSEGAQRVIADLQAVLTYTDRSGFTDRELQDLAGSARRFVAGQELEEGALLQQWTAWTAGGRA